jgi:YD repeat-containing protein
MKSNESLSVKTVLFLLLVTVCLLSSCSDDRPPAKTSSYLDNMGLKGKVKSLIETEYNAESKLGEIQKGNIIKTKAINLFNENGNTLEYQLFNADGSQNAKGTYKYDDKGNMIEVTHFRDGKLSSKDTYEFDNKEYEVNSKSYLPDGSLESRGKNKYDEKGNKIEEIYFQANGKLDTKYTSKFDEKGNVIETNGYNSNGGLTTKTSHRYDEKGNEIEMIYFNAETNTRMIRSFKYDVDGKIVEETVNLGNRITKNTYKYDKYDMNGNWLIKIQESDISPLSIVEREIVYY